ncbi:MAG: aminotransferase class III-fold pyridoxal phosphate-dependent enzyme, partial [Alphaproteobacteria bacterium]
AVRDLSVSFPFNDADVLAGQLKGDDIAAVSLEPAGATAPEPGFLQRLRDLCDHHGTVLIFDEIITGFRMGLGGAQAHYGATPDLAAFGKSMANGMPISAIVGRTHIMRLMEDVFVSGTFGGELLSIAAAIATIDKLERDRIPQTLWQHGDRLRDGANKVIEKRGLAAFMEFQGEGWWPRLTLGHTPVTTATLVSLLRQECTSQGLLLASSFNLCLAHTAADVADQTLAAFDNALGEVAHALASSDPAGRIRGRPVQPVFSIR